MTFKDHFSNDSQGYAGARPTYPAELMGYLASVSPDHHEAWDCGTGSGQAAIGLARHFDHVHGTDASPEQIGEALEAQNIKYSVQPAEQTHFAANQFSLVTVAQALHWFDASLFFQELDRVLKPGGVFAAFGYSFFSFGDAIDEVFQTAILDPIRPCWAPENRLLWDGYEAISFPYEPLESPSFALTMRWDIGDMLDYLGTWSAVRKYQQAIDSELLAKAHKKLEKYWGPEKIREVRQPLILRVTQKS